MGKPMSIPLALGGEWVSGDAGAQPDGTTRLMQNLLPRPNRFPSRAPFAYDGLMAVNGLANFDDPTNKTTRLIGVDTSQRAYTKSASAGVETWSAANVTTITGQRLSSYANYRGKTYMMFDNGTSSVPLGAATYDGVHITVTPFRSSIVSRLVTVYKDRLFLSYPRAVITPLSGQPLTYAYDWTALAVTSANVTQTLVTVAANQYVCRLTPTSVSASACYIEPIVNVFGANTVGIISIPPTASTQYVTWLSGLRGIDPVYEVPLTLELVIVNTVARNGTYSVGDIVTGGNFMFKCTTAGVTAGSAPAYTTTIGSTTTDGTATFICTATDVIASRPLYVPNATDSPDFLNYYLTGGVLPHTNGLYVSPRIKFFNATTTAVSSLVGVDISFRDGLTDGDPRKRNYGQQFTLGDYQFPFFNCETATTATVDLEEEIWSEIGAPDSIQAANTYKMREVPGLPTGACVINNRKLTFKRGAFWQFQGTDDPDIPIRVERLNTVVGCIGPLALDTWNDTAYFIGEYEIFSYSVGGSPTPLCGDGMREEIMGRGTSWVESQSTYNRPILRIDHSKLLMWVYTQAGKLYAYDLTTRSWSTHTLDFAAEIDCMEWNRNTGNMYVSFGGHGLTRMEYNSINYDVIDDTATPHPIDATVIFRPIELFSPPRYDYALQQLRVMHGATEDQTDQTVTASYSFDQGKTFARSTTITLDSASLSSNGEFVPLRLPCRQGRATITAKITHTGKTGEVQNSDGTVQSAWSLSPRAYADVIIRREERVQSNPTQGASNL